MDRFLSGGVTLEKFSSGEFEDSGDFASGRYNVEVKNRGTGQKKRGTVKLTRKGKVGKRDVKITKSVTTKDSSSFKVSYEIEPVSPAIRKKEPVRFGVELNLILPACAGPACSYRFTLYDDGASVDSVETTDIDHSLSSAGELKDVERIELIDGFSGVNVVIEPKDTVELWRFPVETVSLSESGFERIFQGSSLLLLFPEDFNALDEGSIFKSSFVVKVGKV